MPKVVWKDLFSADICRLAQCLHTVQDIAAVYGLSAPGDKDRSRLDIPFPAVSAQSPAQTGRKEDFPGLSLEGNHCPAGIQALYCNEPQFTDPDAGTGDRLHDAADLSVALFLRSLQQAAIFHGRDLFFLAPECCSLSLERHDPAIRPVNDPEKHIEGGDHRIRAGQSVLLAQHLLELQDKALRNLPVPAQPPAECLHIPDILTDRRAALFQLAELIRESLYDAFINIALHFALLPVVRVRWNVFKTFFSECFIIAPFLDQFFSLKLPR